MSFIWVLLIHNFLEETILHNPQINITLIIVNLVIFTDIRYLPPYTPSSLLASINKRLARILQRRRFHNNQFHLENRKITTTSRFCGRQNKEQVERSLKSNQTKSRTESYPLVGPIRKTKESVLIDRLENKTNPLLAQSDPRSIYQDIESLNKSISVCQEHFRFESGLRCQMPCHIYVVARDFFFR